jgi:hypothetical protein
MDQTRSASNTGAPMIWEMVVYLATMPWWMCFVISSIATLICYAIRGDKFR